MAQQGLDLSQIIKQVMGNQDLLAQLANLGTADAAQAKQAVRAAGIPISSDQIMQLMGLLKNVDLGAAMKGIDLSDGFDMKDIQGALSALMGKR